MALPLVPIDLVYSIYDSTEEAIKKIIEANERIRALVGVLVPYLIHENYHAFDYNKAFNTLQSFLYLSDKLQPLNSLFGDANYYQIIEFSLKKAIESGRPVMRLANIMRKRVTLYEELKARSFITKVKIYKSITFLA